MILIRKAKDRGQTSLGWLKSYHTFSFGGYYDPQFLGFGNLLVINEDIVQPNSGFGAHPHKDMEILSYVVEGSIRHQDSTGESHVLGPGEIQKMSAGQGVVHSEANASSSESLHFLQIWILPDREGLTPSYEQKPIPKRSNDLILIGSQDGEDNTVKIHQNVSLYVAYLDQANSIAYNFDDRNYGWLQLVKGSVLLNEQLLSAGDGAAIIDEPKVTIKSLEPAEVLFFDFKAAA